MTQDHTPQLQQWMQQAGFSSFRAFSQAAGISEKVIRRLRRGDLAHMQVATLWKLSQTLQIPVADLLTLAPQSTDHPTDHPTDHQPPSAIPDRTLTELQQEYDRLQTQLSQQRQELWQEFQQTSLQVLESLLLQLPTAAYAAQQNPQAPAVKLLPLLRPLDRLLEEWGITSIAPVGTEVPYDPQQHQLLEGSANPGDGVRVRYTGYRQGDKLLYRAKVSSIVNS